MMAAEDHTLMAYWRLLLRLHAYLPMANMRPTDDGDDDDCGSVKCDFLAYCEAFWDCRATVILWHFHCDRSQVVLTLDRHGDDGDGDACLPS